MGRYAVEQTWWASLDTLVAQKVQRQVLTDVARRAARRIELAGETLRTARRTGLQSRIGVAAWRTLYIEYVRYVQRRRRNCCRDSLISRMSRHSPKYTTNTDSCMASNC